MAASWRITPKIDEANARIRAAAYSLAHYLPLSPLALEGLTPSRRDSAIVQEMHAKESVAAILEEILLGLDGIGEAKAKQSQALLSREKK